MSKRALTCFVLSIVQIVCGTCLLILAVLNIKFKLDQEFCADFTVGSFVNAVFHIVAGSLGAVAYNPRRLPNSNLVCVLFYIIFCVFLLLTFNSNERGCLILLGKNLNAEKSSQFSILLIKLLLAYGSQLTAVLGVSFSCLDLKRFFGKEFANNLNFTDKPDGKQYIQLPEARRHVQQAQGTGEKIVVITLPHTEKVVYAVPEDDYVIRREGAYIAPAGNSRLTMFFPTYNKFQME